MFVFWIIGGKTCLTWDCRMIRLRIWSAAALMIFGSLIDTLFHLRLMIIAAFQSVLAACLGRKCLDLLLSWVFLQSLSLSTWGGKPKRMTAELTGLRLAGRRNIPQRVTGPLLATCPGLNSWIIYWVIISFVHIGLKSSKGVFCLPVLLQRTKSYFWYVPRNICLPTVSNAKDNFFFFFLLS